MSIEEHENSTTVIRPMQPIDIERVVELGCRSIEEGPYRGELEDNPEVTKKLAARLLEMDNAKVLVATDDNGVFGLFAFVLFPHYFSGELTAGELIWYLIPERRNGSPIALELLWAAQKLAKENGAKRMQLTAPSPEIGRMYKQMKYKEIETTYQRVL